MADIKNIRLTDFIQGLQEEDTLDYPNNAVRAGSNVTLAETIQTRGGLSTVDSVGLPAGSEIMSLAQVKFPTNEKTFLIAQVKSTATTESPIDIIPSPEGNLNFPGYRTGLYVFGSLEEIGEGVEDENYQLIVKSLKIVNVDTTILEIDFATGIDDISGTNGTAQEIGSEAGLGLIYSGDDGQNVYSSLYASPYLYFPDADEDVWREAIENETQITSYCEEGTNSNPFTAVAKPRLLVSFYDGEFWYSFWAGISTYGDETYSGYRVYTNSFISQDGFSPVTLTTEDPTADSNLFHFLYVDNGTSYPYIYGSANFGFSFDADEPNGEETLRLNISCSNGGEIRDIKCVADGTTIMHLSFVEHGLLDISGNLGEASLSNGSIEDYLTETGIVLGEEYIYFDTNTIFELIDAADVISWEVTSAIPEGADGCGVTILPSNPSFPGDVAHFRVDFDSGNYGHHIGRTSHGEMSAQNHIPVYYIPNGESIYSKLTITESQEWNSEFEYWYTAAVDTATVSFAPPEDGVTTYTYWSLYAMPDTLPDTGA